MNVRRAGLLVSSLLLASLPVFLSGCASISGVTAGGMGDSNGGVTTLSGKAHGGFNFIGGATVTMYATGTNYGTAKAIATTSTSTANGSFGFSQVPGAPNDGNSSSFACPSDTSSLLYMVTRGGNTSGSGDVTQGGVTTQNPAAALVTIIGPCSGSESYPYFTINESTTVAAAVTMAQFMNATTTDVFIGAPSSVAVGLQNSYATFNNVVNVTTGIFNNVFTPTSTVGNGGISAFVEADKLTTMANILASCVNTDEASPYSTASCGTLFANAKPPAVQTNNQPVTTTAATDTAMAAYYLAINPTQSPAQSTAMYNLLSSTSQPFGPGVGTTPNDWTIAISYNPVNATGVVTTCLTSSAQPLQGSITLAVDAVGNVWAGGYQYSPTNAYNGVPLSELSPSGGLINCIGDEQGNPLIVTDSMAIDSANNVWYMTSYTDEAVVNQTYDQGGLYEYKGSGLPVSWPVPGGDEPYLILADKAGDITWANGTGDTNLYVIPGASTASTPVPSTVSAAPPDGQNFVFLTLSYYGNSVGPYVIGPTYNFSNPSTSDIAGYLPSTTSPTTPGGTPYSQVQASLQSNAAVGTDNNGLIFGAGAWGQWFSGVPSAVSDQGPLLNFSTDNTYLGGMSVNNGVAVDGLNHYWGAVEYPSIDANPTTGTAEVDGIAEVSFSNGAWTAISPAPTNTSVESTCATNYDCPIGGSYQIPMPSVNGGLVSTAIDPSGNVWAGMGASSGGLVELLGAAAPVVTPLVNQPMGKL